MLYHLQGLVASDTLHLLRGATGLIKGRSSVLPQAVELDRAKSKTRLVTPPDGVEATLRQRPAVPPADNIETLALHYRQFIGWQLVPVEYRRLLWFRAEGWSWRKLGRYFGCGSRQVRLRWRDGAD